MPDASEEAVMKRVEAILRCWDDVGPDACLHVSHEANSWADSERAAGNQIDF